MQSEPIETLRTMSGREHRAALQLARRRRLGMVPDPKPLPVPPKYTKAKIDDEFRRRILNARVDKVSVADHPETSLLAKDFFRIAWEQFDSGVMMSSIDVIQRAVAIRYDIPLAEMTSHRRGKEFVRPRQIAMYLARRLAKENFTVIAAAFGGRDHATVMYAVASIERLVRQDGLFADEVRTVMSQIRATVREAA